MKPLRLGLLVGALILSAALVHASTPSKAASAAQAASTLGARLKQRLVAAMQADGPVAAIGVCNLEAPAIAAGVSTEAGLRVGRTSLRLRNPDNAPTARERRVLQRWSALVAEGTAPGALEVHVEDSETFLWMKPIVVEGPCLACHGAAIAEPVAAALAERYPGDRATGYALGDLRGAFTVRAVETAP